MKYKLKKMNMKTKNLNLLMAFALGVSLMFATSATYAQCQHQKQAEQQQGQQQVTPNNTKPGCCGIKDLTPDQEKQMKSLKQKMVKEVLPLKNQVAEKKAHLNTISTGDNVDMTAVNKTIDELYALKAEIAKKQNQFKQDVRKLLNDEQKVMFDMHQGKGNKWGKGKGCGHNSGNGPSCGQGAGKGCGTGQNNGGAGCGMGQGQGKGGCKDKSGTGTHNPGCNHQQN